MFVYNGSKHEFNLLHNLHLIRYPIWFFFHQIHLQFSHPLNIHGGSIYIKFETALFPVLETLE